jgi:hypothetical protein
MRIVDQYMRGRMLDSLFELLLAEDLSTQLRYLRFETTSHTSYGVRPHMYENLLAAVRDTVRRLCGSDWTPGMSVAWNSRLERLLGEIRSLLRPTTVA